ncbi:MAG: class II aldolase/adducin family protein [Anaerolineae bacterium]|nr:class II aldolase/adducin family protein [Anaerolineae bacterium]
MADVLEQLIEMTQHLGEPAKDYVILGEGNTSTRADAETFWVKCSGSRMEGIGPDGFVRVRFAPVLATLEAGELSDAEIKERLIAAKADPAAPGHPSIEALLHALALGLPGVTFVGHTHPVAVNGLMCSARAEEAISGRIFPDEIVVCGPAPAFVPYSDPGIPLGRTVWRVLQEYIARHGVPPKTVYMQNHGLIALGAHPLEVENITAMAVKTARIVAGTYALGGPRFLSAADVERINTRPDEARRKAKLLGQTEA